MYCCDLTHVCFGTSIYLASIYLEYIHFSTSIYLASFQYENCKFNQVNLEKNKIWNCERHWFDGIYAFTFYNPLLKANTIFNLEQPTSVSCHIRTTEIPNLLQSIQIVVNTCLSQSQYDFFQKNKTKNKNKNTHKKIKNPFWRKFWYQKKANFLSKPIGKLQSKKLFWLEYINENVPGYGNHN